MWAIKLSFDLEIADSSVTGFLGGPPVLIAGGIAEAVVLLAVAGRDGAGKISLGAVQVSRDQIWALSRPPPPPL